MYTYFLLPCIRKELPVVSPVDTKYVRYIATCRNYYVYANTLISLWCNPLFQLLMPYRMCKCNSLCCKDRIIKVKDKRYKTYNRKEWEHIISETFHADQYLIHCRTRKRIQELHRTSDQIRIPVQVHILSRNRWKIEVQLHRR